MADAVTEPTPGVPAPARDEQLRRPRPEPNVPRHRFGIAYLILAVVLGTAVGLFVVFAADGGKDSGQAWSTWEPQAVGVRKLNEIAEFVADGYALPDGRKLVGIFSGPPAVQDQGQPVTVRAIGVSSGLPGETGEDQSFYEASNAWAFNLCGSAKKPSCALPGQISRPRYDLLRREALELTLYAFKYEPKLEMVVTYMPPAVDTSKSNATANTAVFLRRQDVAAALGAPLARTLSPAAGTLRPGKISARDLDAVRQYTDKHVYQYQFQALQDGSPVLALVPLDVG